MSHKPVEGYQIVHAETDEHPEGMTSYEIYPLNYCLEWIDNNRSSTDLNPDWQCWRLCPIYEGDVEEAVFVNPYDEDLEINLNG